ncbi:hypothetical protein F4802DRAFT_46704 [Xylaria palmicola]|nr:hypothetical protein F4802DRAFT_46704 [Xylaria palmicola]
MKWTTPAITLGFIAGSVLAAPTDGLDLFKLKISSTTNRLNGRYLSSNASTLGVYDSDEFSPIRVYQTSSSKKGCTQLHTYPVGIVDHALALVGADGLMTLTDMVNPAGSKPVDGRVTEWEEFKVSDTKLTNNGQGSWIAFPTTKSSWSVKWTDGSAFTTANYMPVEIVMESAGEGRYNEQ